MNTGYASNRTGLLKWGVRGMNLYVMLGTHVLAVLRYADVGRDEPEGIYCKKLYQDWERLPLKVTYTTEDERLALNLIKAYLPTVVGDYVTTEGEL